MAVKYDPWCTCTRLSKMPIVGRMKEKDKEEREAHAKLSRLLVISVDSEMNVMGSFLSPLALGQSGTRW